jgi:hypothetical protein
MGLIEVYLLFAATTAVVSIYELVWPVLQQLSLTHTELNVVQHTKITVFVFFVMSFVMAPFLLVPCLWPSKGERFRNTLYISLQNT